MRSSNGDIQTKLVKRLIVVATICSLNIILIFFYHHIDKFLTGPLYLFLTSLIPATLIAIIIYFFKGIVGMIRNRKSLTSLMLLPTVASLLTLIYVFTWSYKFSSESWESDVVLKGCFEGTQNQATLKFRADKTFEIHWTSAFFGNSWYRGTYDRNADTLLLKYTTEQPERFGNKILFDNQSFKSLNYQNFASTRYVVSFYNGDCKGLN
jgi:hypothetical protein